MAKPIAYFGYSKTGLTVNFQNSSLNSPIEYEWDFGDGETSQDKSPSHTYTEMGFFTVTLIARNTDGEGELTITIGASDIDDMMNASLIELIDHYLPSALKAEMTATEKVSLIQKWQMYLQPLIYFPHKVDVTDTYNEFKWPGLANVLIAQLVAYDITVQAANQFVSSSMRTGGGSTSTEESSGKQQLKSVETGPAKTEWYEDKSSEDIKNLADAVASATKAGGGIDLMKESICMLSQRIYIYLPMCPMPDISVSPRVYTRCRPGVNAANPFGSARIPYDRDISRGLDAPCEPKPCPEPTPLPKGGGTWDLEP